MKPKLSCGGKGPCCHVGYSHRHCEHCDMVIDTRQVQWTYPTYPQPWYQPWYSGGLYPTVGITNGEYAFITTGGNTTTVAEHFCNVIELPQTAS